LSRERVEIDMIKFSGPAFPGVRFDPDHPPRRRCETLFFRGFATLPIATAGSGTV